MSILVDLYEELQNISSISSIVGDRIFHLKPKDEQTDSYIFFDRTSEPENDVRLIHNMRIFCFSADDIDLETLSNEIRDYLNGRTELNSNEYYKVTFIDKTDLNVRLTNGFISSILAFEIHSTS